MSVYEEQTHPQSLKRDHDQFLSGEREIASGSLGMDSSYRDIYPSPLEEASHKERTVNPEQSILTPPTSITTTRRGTSPARSSTGSLSDARSTTPSLQSNSPTPIGPPTLAPVAALKHPDGTLAPPPKKAKLTPAEKELRRINKVIKDQERAAEKARREVERLAHAEEKARKEAEKEAEKKKREAEREEKRAAQDAEKAAKEEKRKQREEDKQQREEEKRQKDDGKRQKEEEKKRAEEEKRKKDRSQMKLNSFFVQKSNAGDRTSLSPAPSNPALLGAAATSPAPPTSSKREASYYDQTFPAFFVQAHVTVAPITRFERDEETSKIQQTIIDSYILRNRSPGRRRSFDALSLFHLPTNAVRGKHCIPVREIMAEMSNSASRPIDLTSDSQNSQIRRTGHLLKKVPLKYLKFAEDVRPPYRGTYTNQPLHGVAKLARNPLRRDLPDTNYDYDSEAEWIEDEDAEDLNSEGEEDDVELDDADDMDGFLDDENDELLTSKRQVLQGDLEPISTGLCWEDQSRNNTNTRMVDYRMETILDEKLRSIDPFSTGYWEPVSTKVTTMDPPRLPLNTLKSNSLCNNSLSSTASTTSKPVKPFFAPASTYSNFSIDPAASKAQYAANKGKEKKLLPKEDWASFKDEVQGSNLSKVGLIEVLKKRFPKATGGMVKATLEAVAQRVGKKESEKRWIVNEDAGAVSMASN